MSVAAGATAYKHIGLYGYRRSFLLALSELPQTPLELSESLEQLRALEHGYRIHTVETQYDSIGVTRPATWTACAADGSRFRRAHEAA
jgi:3-deoxy-manno-octulosonate cytidylyltransferase (CMP-KDO synthetase)